MCSRTACSVPWTSPVFATKRAVERHYGWSAGCSTRAAAAVREPHDGCHVLLARIPTSSTAALRREVEELQDALDKRNSELTTLRLQLEELRAAAAENAKASGEKQAPPPLRHTPALSP